MLFPSKYQLMPLTYLFVIHLSLQNGARSNKYHALAAIQHV